MSMNAQKPTLRLKLQPKVQPKKKRETKCARRRRQRLAHDSPRAKLQHKTMMQMRAWLLRTFPKCFQPFGSPKLPLKIYIFNDIMCRHLSLRHTHDFDLAAALKDYTSGATYLRAMTAGAVRVDLDGNPAGTVTEGHAKFAAGLLAKQNTPQEGLAGCSGSLRSAPLDEQRAAGDAMDIKEMDGSQVENENGR